VKEAVASFDVSPDGKWICVVTSVSERPKTKLSVRLDPTAGGKPTLVDADPRMTRRHCLRRMASPSCYVVR